MYRLLLVALIVSMATVGFGCKKKADKTKTKTFEPKKTDKEVVRIDNSR